MPVISDLLLEPIEDVDWLVYPLVAKGHITFFHGKSGLGKTPFSWEIARAVSLGLPLTTFGSEVRRQGTVLYIEAETNRRGTIPRLKLLPEPKGTWWYEDAYSYDGGVNILKTHHPSYHSLKVLQESIKPDLVIWSSLLRFLTHETPLNQGETVTMFYGIIHRLFPQAGHLIIAHDKKDPSDPKANVNEDEAFSGSGAWPQQAQIALHVTPRHANTPGTHATVKITKSQIGSKDHPPLKLHLDPNGTTWLNKAITPLVVQEKWSECPPTVTDKADWVAAELGISPATVFRLKAKTPDLKSF